jgi:membrane-bound lytic murein transglycosylase D
MSANPEYEATVSASFRDHWDKRVDRKYQINQAADSRQIDLWQRIRKKFSLAKATNLRIDRQIEYLNRNPYHVHTLVERSQPFLHYIVEAIDRRKLPMELVMVPMVESGFRPTALSAKDAAGLWQIIPATGKYLGLAYNDWYDGRQDIYASTQAALNYLEYLSEVFAGDWLLALAAYNAGEGTVKRALRNKQRIAQAVDYWSLDLPAEAMIYVPKLLALAHVVADPQFYGITLQRIDDRPYLYRVNLGQRVKLTSIAAMANMSEEKLRYFNPCLRRDTTPPYLSYGLLLPRNNARTLLEKLANFPGIINSRYLFVKQDDLFFEPLRWYTDLAIAS